MSALGAVAVVGDDVFPLAGVRAGHHGHHGFGIAQVEHFVRYAGLDIDKVAGLVVHYLFETGAVLVAHPAPENVEHDVEIDVDVGAGDTARRNGGHVHRQLGRGHVLGGQAGLVLDAVPTPAGAAAAD